MAQKKRAPDAGKHAFVLCAAERQSSTTVPFGTTVMPSGVTVKPRARSCSVSMPTILGKHNILVEDRLVDACSTIDGHAVEQNRIDDLGPRVDTHVRRKHGMMHFTARYDDARGDDRVGGVSETVATGMDELRWRQIAG